MSTVCLLIGGVTDFFVYVMIEYIALLFIALLLCLQRKPVMCRLAPHSRGLSFL